MDALMTGIGFPLVLTISTIVVKGSIKTLMMSSLSWLHFLNARIRTSMSAVKKVTLWSCSAKLTMSPDSTWEFTSSAMARCMFGTKIGTKTARASLSSHICTIMSKMISVSEAYVRD